MKYRLKDKELQRKLDDLSDGDFSVQLQKIEHIVLDALSGPVVHFGGLARVIDDRFRHLAPRFTLRFHRDELEEEQEFDPNHWNSWPDVEPPKGGLMRVQFKTKEHETLWRSCWMWTGECWAWADGRGSPLVNVGSLREIRFRPWEDKE